MPGPPERIPTAERVPSGSLDLQNDSVPSDLDDTYAVLQQLAFVNDSRVDHVGW